MRMKLKKSSQLLLAAALSLAAAGFLSACATLTTDFVFVTSAKAAGVNSYGEVNVLEVNSESGHMRQIPTSPFPSGGRNPVAEAVASDNTTLYVVNRDDNTIVEFTIGNDGKVYPQNTYNTPGIFPTSTAVAGTNLFVADTYQPLAICSPASPCTGSFAVFPVLGATSTQDRNQLQRVTPLNSCNGLQYQPVALSGSASDHIVLPTAITAYSGSGTSGSATVYVAAYDTTANAGYVFGYTVSTATQTCNSASVVVPTVTPIPGSPWSAGVYPSAIATTATGSYVYVTDSTSGDVLGFSASSGSLTPLSGSPYPSGNQPSAVVVDASEQYAYVTNSQDSNVTAYTISSGVLTRIGGYTTGTQPVAIGIDPSLHEFLYTANFLGNTVSGFQIQASDGTLVNSKGISSATNANPTAIAAVPHHAVSKQ